MKVLFIFILLVNVCFSISYCQQIPSTETFKGGVFPLRIGSVRSNFSPPDTNRCILLVCDTSYHHKWYSWDTEKTSCRVFGSDFIPPMFAYWEYGYVIHNYVEDKLYFLDAELKNFPPNIIVWLSKKIN